jgi:hypothetical protein
MTADQYLETILNREAVPTGVGSPLWGVQRTLEPMIREWANGRLLNLHASGSFMKGTANLSGTDIDLFISLSENTIESLSEIHQKLLNRLRERGYTPRPQNVSINVKALGYSVDLVPAKRQNAYGDDHSLYRRKADSWTKTNVLTHIQHVAASGRAREIRIIKLWRDQRSLDFPSFYLELTVLAALAAQPSWISLSQNVQTVFEYLQDSFPNARVMDPANTNNVISDDLTQGEKHKISAAAKAAREAPYWENIVR